MAGKVSSIKEYWDTIADRFVAEGAKGVNAVFQFELSGNNGGTWHLTVTDGNFALAEGAHASPSCTLKMDADNFLKMSNGELNGTMAYMTGKMKIAGNLMMAQKMQNIFPPGK